MASKSALLLVVAAALSGCAYRPSPLPDAGVAAVNVPVVNRADYVFDAAAPYGALPANEAERLDNWFDSLDLRYGDAVYVDGQAAPSAREDVARIAGNYGLLVSAGAPVTTGMVPAGVVRVIVSRTVASVPGCPNWERPASPNYNNQMIPNFGCSVNSNLAAMVANPEDLVHGRDGSGVLDSQTSTRAIRSYRDATPTGTQGLKDISTKKGN